MAILAICVNDMANPKIILVTAIMLFFHMAKHEILRQV